jgi:hypothetical protein
MILERIHYNQLAIGAAIMELSLWARYSGHAEVRRISAAL